MALHAHHSTIKEIQLFGSEYQALQASTCHYTPFCSVHNTGHHNTFDIFPTTCTPQSPTCQPYPQPVNDCSTLHVRHEIRPLIRTYIINVHYYCAFSDLGTTTMLCDCALNTCSKPSIWRYVCFRLLCICLL